MSSTICQGHISSNVSLDMSSSMKLNLLRQISCCKGTEETVVAIPYQISDMVSASFRASSHNGGIRAGRVCVLRLGRLLVSTEEERFPIRIPIPFGRLNLLLGAGYIPHSFTLFFLFCHTNPCRVLYLIN